MSSHREAPAISKDPVADNTDLYAFVSTDDPDGSTVTMIANYIPLEGPAGGPNFYEFGEDVLYEIHIDNDGDAKADVTYQFRFTTHVLNPDTFLYNTGQITVLNDPHWNRPQFYSVTQVKGDQSSLLGEKLACPPCNIGPRSTPNYEAKLGSKAVNDLGGGVKVFAGQRSEGFYVDLGSIFDLLALRPFQSLHRFHPPESTSGVNATKDLNVNSIAIQVPKTALTSDGSAASDPTDPRSVIGVWATAGRQKALIREKDAKLHNSGPFVQVSRLGNPLINEVVIPMGSKDLWNALDPDDDAQFLKYVEHPEVAGLLPFLYPNVFPNLAGYGKARADLVAILMTGIPDGVVPTFPGNFTGTTIADMLRLNVAIKPKNASRLGVVGGDNSGFPNGRRVSDDVVTVELRAIAGLTIPLVDKTFTPDGAAALIEDGTNNPAIPVYLGHFPYLGTPFSGYDKPAA
jgi:hypothetical protein